jgi:hypothetical protein
LSHSSGSNNCGQLKQRGPLSEGKPIEKWWECIDNSEVTKFEHSLLMNEKTLITVCMKIYYRKRNHYRNMPVQCNLTRHEPKKFIDIYSCRSVPLRKI